MLGSVIKARPFPSFSLLTEFILCGHVGGGLSQLPPGREEMSCPRWTKTRTAFRSIGKQGDLLPTRRSERTW